MAKVIKENQKTQGNQDAQAMAGASGESIDQIREILFGTAQREHQSRMGQIEARVAQHAVEAEARLKKVEETLLARLDKMAKGFESSLDQLSESLRQAQAEARSDLKETATDLADRISEVETRLGGELQEQGDGLREDIAGLRAELRDAERRLDNEKTDRVDLGNHFLEIGKRLSGEVVSLPPEACVERPRKVKSDAEA